MLQYVVAVSNLLQSSFPAQYQTQTQQRQQAK